MRMKAKRGWKAVQWMHRAVRRCAFVRDETGAMAATYALALTALVGAAGVAWDWNRLVTIDTELQAAADQAALAAATQLDGKTGAIARATAAASNLVVNDTLLSNDGAGTAVTIESVTFYTGYNQAADSYESVTTADATARVVKVVVVPRDAVYTMTPVVGVFRKDDNPGEATASLGSAICNTPPVMICNPREDDGEQFNPNNFIGHGLKLISDDAGAPGNFGFLRNGLGNGTPELSKSLGWDNQPGKCVPGTGVTTEPGLKDVVFNAINTRFDIDVNGANTCPGASTNCTAAANVRKDLVKDDLTGSNCGTNGNQSWQQAKIGERYITPTNRYLTTTEIAAIKVMGLPRDTCHAWSEAGNCASDPDAGFDQYGIIGSSNWDRDAYFKVNFGWSAADWPTNTGLSSTATRYQVYKWEVARALSNAEKYQQDSDGKDASAVPICRNTGSADRRILTAAVINCDAEGVNGFKENVAVAYWVEVLLVEPSMTRYVGSNSTAKLTDPNDVYVEIIRAVDVGDDGNVGKVVRRDVPYLIR